MRDSISAVKSQVIDLGFVNVSAIEPDSRDAAIKSIVALKKLANKKLDEGFIQKRIPIKNGYREIFVMPK